jgi:hypothetical protein
MFQEGGLLPDPHSPTVAKKMQNLAERPGITPSLCLKRFPVTRSNVTDGHTPYRISGHTCANGQLSQIT